MPHVLAQQPAPPGNLETEFLFKFGAAVRNQIVTRVGVALVRPLPISMGFAAGPFGALYRALRNFNFSVI